MRRWIWPLKPLRWCATHSSCSFYHSLNKQNVVFSCGFTHQQMKCLCLQASEQGRPPEHTSKFYAKGALQYLVPILTQTLTKQVIYGGKRTFEHGWFLYVYTFCSVFLKDENDDDDDWNPCKAAGVCLMLLATCCEDDVVPHVLPFIKEHIKHPDWRYRDASVMAFGSILEGPELNQLKPLVIQVTLIFRRWVCVLWCPDEMNVCMRVCETGHAHPHWADERPQCGGEGHDGLDVRAHLWSSARGGHQWDVSGPSAPVPDRGSWGRASCGLQCLLGNDETDFIIVLSDLLLLSRIHFFVVKTNVSFQAFSSLAEAAYEATDAADDQEEPSTYCLSSSFELIVQKLLETTDRYSLGD